MTINHQARQTAKRRLPEKIWEDFFDPNQALAALANVAVCRRLEEQIRMLERALLPRLRRGARHRALQQPTGRVVDVRLAHLFVFRVSPKTGQIAARGDVGGAVADGLADHRAPFVKGCWSYSY